MTPRKGPWAHLMFAHGAGGSMDHPWMVTMAHALEGVGIVPTRYNFPFTQGPQRRPPNPPQVLMARVRHAVEAGHRAHPGLPLVAGGKSLGGRMTAYAQAESPLPHVRGLVFFGFPLHPPKKPSTVRAEPLEDITIPMLFLQGTRDTLADRDLMREVCEGLGPRATLLEIDGANHGFALPKRMGKTEADVQQAMARALEAWLQKVIQ